MNPGPIRKAIVDALEQREAWAGVDLFRYPSGDRADWKQGFELGEVTGVDIEALDLSGDNLQVAYSIPGSIWVAKEGAKDDDYEDTEGACFALVLDLWRWSHEVAHGKGMAVDGVTVDSLEVPLTEVSFAAQPALTLVELIVDVTEMVQP